MLSKKLKDCDNQDLVQALKAAIAVVGLRADNMPTPEETNVLVHFIRRNYSGHTPKEIALAFELAAAGKLDEEAKTYENFSCEYVGRILNSYRRYASTLFKERLLQSEQKAIAAQLPPSPSDWSKEWKEVKERAKNNNWVGFIIPLPIYDWLLKTKMLELTVEDKKDLFTRSKETIKTELLAKVAAGKADHSDLTTLKILKAESFTKGDSVHSLIANRAKMEAIKELAIAESLNEEL